MRLILATLAALVLISTQARASGIFWTGPVDVEVQTSTAQQLGADPEPLTALDLMNARFGFGQLDAESLDLLSQSLNDSRQYSNQLDGELVIMQDLQPFIQAVTFLRNDTDRERLYAALMYQGFAINRFFGDTLGSDEKAAPFRVLINDTWVEKPWADAIGLEPNRSATAVEISEAPQRAAFEQLRSQLQDTIPGAIKWASLPDDIEVMVDGRTVEVSASANLRLPAGRHLIHATVSDQTIGRWDAQIHSGEVQTLQLEVAVDSVKQLLIDLKTLEPPPDLLLPLIDSAGGLLWVASPEPLTVYRVTADQVTEVTPDASVTAARVDAPWEILLSSGMGWMYSGDFYLQDPTVPRTVATVNAMTIDISMAAQWRFGSLWRVGAGVDTVVTLGEYHFAAIGQNSTTRVRLVPYVSGGLPWVQLLAGYQFPYHPMVGSRVSIPLSSKFGLVANATRGIPTNMERANGSSWSSTPTVHIWMGAHWVP